MTTFDLVEVRDFVAGLDSRIGPAPNGSRDDPTALAAARRGHAAICRDFTETVREWRWAIFSGRIELDPAVESLILAEAGQLAARADDLHRPAPSDEASGSSSDELGEFLAAVEPIRRMVRSWLPPPPRRRTWPAELDAPDSRDGRGRPPPGRGPATAAGGLAVHRRATPGTGPQLMDRPR